MFESFVVFMATRVIHDLRHISLALFYEDPSIKFISFHRWIIFYEAKHRLSIPWALALFASLLHFYLSFVWCYLFLYDLLPEMEINKTFWKDEQQKIYLAFTVCHHATSSFGRAILQRIYLSLDWVLWTGS